MTPQELKNSILQLAIQGKLVEQRPEEGTAEELFARIQQEKQRLIREGKIKKEKPLPEITEDEKPFDIPEGWKWIRLGEISSLITKGTTPRGGNVSYLEDGIGFLRAENVAGLDKLDKTNLKYIDKNTHTGYLKRSIIEENDILITIAGTLGRTAIVKRENLPLNANQAVSIVRLVNNHSIDLLYLIYALNSGGIQKYLTAQKKTTAIPNLTLEIIENCILPLPSLAEQKRIVAKIEELLPYIDRYEQAWNKLEQFNSRFPEDMKKSLLQYAIQGKLVEQRPEEGTGEELFAQIQEVKQQLIKEVKIKKEKPLPEITDDEKPFDIPESWKWVRVGDVFAHNTGKAMNSTAKKVDKPGDIRRFITTSNLYWNSFDFSSVKEMFFSDDELERCTVTKGDLLMCEGGAYYGRTAIWNYDYDICFQNHVHRLRPYKVVELLFFYHLFFFYKSMNMMNAKGTAMPGLSSQTLHQMVIPLPPLAEQKRIVEKLEQLLPLCERLK